jgi:hypothetical protein
VRSHYSKSLAPTEKEEIGKHVRRRQREESMEKIQMANLKMVSFDIIKIHSDGTTMRTNFSFSKTISTSGW